MKKYIVVLIIVTGLVYYAVDTRLEAIRSKKIGKNIGAIKKETGIPVKVINPEFREQVEETMEFSGSVQASKSVTVSARLEEEIVESHLVLGKKVKKSELLVQLRDDMINSQVELAKAAVDQTQAMLDKAHKGARPQELKQAMAAVNAAQARMDNARKDNERMKELQKNGAIPRQKADAITAGYEGAKANLDAAKQRLSLVRAGARKEDVRAAKAAFDQATALYDQSLIRQKFTKVYSPIEGIISMVKKEESELSEKGKPLFTILGLEKVHLEIEVSEYFINRLKKGMAVKCSTRSLPNEIFEGIVDEISPQSDHLTRVYKVKVLIDNPGFMIKPGMFMKGRVTLETINDACIIPRDCLVLSDGKYQINLVEDCKVLTSEVYVRELGSNTVAVTPLLKKNSKVIIQGQNDVMAGSKVLVRNTEN